jgi:hypothetical protein
MHVSSTQNKPLIAMPTNAMSDHHPAQLAAIVKYHTVSRNQPARQGMLKSLMRQCSSPAPKFRVPASCHGYLCLFKSLADSVFMKIIFIPLPKCRICKKQTQYKSWTE